MSQVAQRDMRTGLKNNNGPSLSCPVALPRWFLPGQMVNYHTHRLLNLTSLFGALAKIDFLKVLRSEGLLSPAARQIYKRNCPPVGLIQSRTVYWCVVNQTRSRHMKSDLNCFDPNWSVYFFAGCITISFYRLYSNTMPSASDSANASYQGRDRVWVKESELQRCSGTSTTSDRGLLPASSLLGDRSFIGQKTNWMHEQNNEFTRHDEFTCQMLSEEREKTFITFGYFLY